MLPLDNLVQERMQAWNTAGSVEKGAEGHEKYIAGARETLERVQALYRTFAYVERRYIVRE